MSENKPYWAQYMRYGGFAADPFDSADEAVQFLGEQEAADELSIVGVKSPDGSTMDRHEVRERADEIWERDHPEEAARNREAEARAERDRRADRAWRQHWRSQQPDWFRRKLEELAVTRVNGQFYRVEINGTVLPCQVSDVQFHTEREYEEFSPGGVTAARALVGQMQEVQLTLLLDDEGAQFTARDSITMDPPKRPKDWTEEDES